MAETNDTIPESDYKLISSDVQNLSKTTYTVARDCRAALGFQ
jgi:hypothetical protein